ncbi:MAG: ral secretion pathway protein [Alphaproteobacteria bacterium]|nr:ral secretion pathway protein [Alphaproteobacteria bacterium]
MYTDYYGLSERPFQLTPDARFYFSSRTHRKAMAYLGYGIAQGEGFIVITGDIGAGKSTLVQHLLTTIDRARRNAISLVSTQVEGDDMLRLVAQGMGISTGGLAKAQLLDEIEQWLRGEARARKRTLLIVDEAQNLSVSALEELRMLSNFQLTGQALIQILLLGQPEFRDKLAGADALEQLRQRVIATHHLDPMEPSEVEPYIVHRLAVVGWQGQPRFTADAFAALHRHSDGIPRRLNQLASRLMLYAGIEHLDTIGDDVVESVVADMLADAPPERQSHEAPKYDGPKLEGRVLPLRGASISPVVAEPEDRPASEALLERRVAALEARLEEQEVALRRILTLLVDWVENGQQAPSYRHNAA